jgi:hypothetical protein
MSQAADEELYKILHLDDRQAWMPESLAAAEREWSKRQLPPDRVEQLAAYWEEEKRIANEPLGWLGRIGFFCLVGIFAIPWPFAIRNQGYRRKYREAWIWMGLGVLFWGLLLEVLR